MHLDPWILTFSTATVLVTIWMGFWSARRSKTTSDFFVAGRSVSVGWNASAISGEYLSAASFMGVAGMVMSSGYDALWYPVCYACGYLFLLLFIAGPLRRFGAYTIPDFAEGRFDSPLFRKIAVVFVLFIGFFYTMPQMKGAGTTLSYIFQDLDFRGTALAFLAPHEKGEALKGLHYGVGVFLVGAVITLNVALGGMKGITLVQAFQYWAKMFAISVPIFVLMAVYGHYGEQVDLNAPEIRRLRFQSAAEMDQVQLDGRGLLYMKFGHASLSFAANHPREAKRILKDAIGLNTMMEDGFIITNQPTLAQLRGYYGFFSGKAVYWFSDSSRERKDEQQFTIDLTLFRTKHAAASAIERLLHTNAVDVFQLNRTQALFLSQKQFAAVMKTAGITNVVSNREPLPAKAPRDETWLNPFGPLTTKAATAAKPQVRYDGPLEDYASLHFGTNEWTGVQRMLEVRFGADPMAGFGGLNGLLMRYACAAVLSEPMNFDRKLVVLGAPSLVGNKVSDLSINTSGKSYREAAELLLAAFQTNGISIVRESGNVFKAFPTKATVIVPVDTRPYALLYTYSLIIALVCGTAGLPHILVRFYTNPDGVAAKRTTMWVMILIGVFYLFPPVFGVMGRNLMPSLYEGAGAKGTDKVVLELPRLLNEGAGERGGEGAGERGGEGVGERGSGGVGASNASLPRSLTPPTPVSLQEKRRNFPWGSILSGITCAGAFAAFMSTFSGLLVSMTGAMAHDVYGRMLNPKSTGEQRLRAFKIAAVAIGGGAVLLGFLVESFEINKMVGWAFAIAATSYFPLLFLSTWWRGITMKGAATGMLVGGTLSLVAIASTMFADQAAWAAGLRDYYAAHPLLRILAEQPAIWALPLALGLMVLLSKLTAKDVPADIRMKMLVLHAPEKLGLKQEYIQEHEQGH
jgi:Na+(H+)/acetate symporter ActP